MRLLTQIAIVASLAAVLAAGWWLIAGESESEAAKSARKRSAKTLVLIEKVRFAEEKVVVRSIGTGEALKSASIYPSVSGEVMSVDFKAGDRVAKGTALLRLDDKHQRLAHDLAKVGLKEAQRQLKRMERLAPKGAATLSSLENAQTALESARLRLAQARAALEDRTVFAPFEGIIGLTEIENGDRVTEETMIATLDDRSSILVEFRLPEEYASRLNIGDVLDLRPWTLREREIEATVATMGSRIDPITRSLRVKAEIANPDPSIRPGTSFDVRIAFTGGSYASIPEVAVLWSRDGAYLWQVVDGKARKIFVTIVRRDKGRILVDGPLKSGDIIVVEGVQGLRAGQAVEPKPFADENATQEPKRVQG